MPRTAITLVQRTAGNHAYWDARWHDHSAGKRRSKTLGRVDALSERQARKRVAELEAEFQEDPHLRSPDGVPTLSAWLDIFIQRKEAAGRKPKTLVDYRLLKRLLEAYFGPDRRLSTITKFHLEAFRVKLAKQELRQALNPKNTRKANAASVSKYMRLVSAVFTAAYDDELILRNPARKLGLGQCPAAEWTKVDADTFWRLHDKAQGGMKTLLALCRLAGMRLGDALALQWSNVRLDEGVLVFRPIKVERFAKRDARVPIAAELKAILEELRQGGFPIDGFVVARDLPKHLYPHFDQICKSAGLTPWSKPFHTLRKSCIDDWARVAPPNVVMEWATHTAIATTMKYYSKVHQSDEKVGQARMFRPAAETVAAIG